MGKDRRDDIQARLGTWVGKNWHLHAAVSALLLLVLTFAASGERRTDAGRGEIVRADGSYAEAENVIRPLADNGAVESQYALGLMYDNGAGVPQDYALAAKWYLKAARGGHTDAQNSIGMMYLFGRGIEKNIGEALGWFRRAANQGNALAQANLGDLYYDGVGVNKDMQEALRWYRRASNQGDSHGHLSLGWMYFIGLGVPAQDNIEAYKLTRLAADQGAENAEDNLAIIAAQMTPGEILRADRLARTWTGRKE